MLAGRVMPGLWWERWSVNAWVSSCCWNGKQLDNFHLSLDISLTPYPATKPLCTVQHAERSPGALQKLDVKGENPVVELGCDSGLKRPKIHPKPCASYYLGLGTCHGWETARRKHNACHTDGNLMAWIWVTHKLRLLTLPPLERISERRFVGGCELLRHSGNEMYKCMRLLAEVKWKTKIAQSLYKTSSLRSSAPCHKETRTQVSMARSAACELVGKMVTAGPYIQLRGCNIAECTLTYTILFLKVFIVRRRPAISWLKANCLLFWS